jgi:hypothetical protein
VTVSTTRNLDDLELELRKLPGVRAAGFTERDDLLVVQVQVTDGTPSPSLSQEAARIAYRHADKPIALEVVRWRTIEVPSAAPPVAEVVAAPPPPVAVDATTAPPELAGDRAARVRLLAVLTFPDTDELEVHLTYGGRRVIGRAAASTGVGGAVGATLEGLRDFAPALAADVLWAEELAGHEAAHASVVACALQADGHTLLGIAAGGSRIEAAARSALHALNRTLESRVAPAT